MNDYIYFKAMLDGAGVKFTEESAGGKICIMLDGTTGGVADFTFENGVLVKVVVANN